MKDYNTGIVVVTEFCTADNSKFESYINYMDRDEARQEHTADYVLDEFKDYLDYMDNPEKVGGLFTNDKDSLNDKEIKDLQSVYKTAQGNESLMWQTVLSFDNAFLREVGIYDEEFKNLDDKKLKAAARKAINKMLEKENLQNAVWSGAIHYNTDNIHIHVATVEPTPLREKKRYNQYEKIKVEGKWKYKLQTNKETGKKERIPILDNNGNIVTKEEYKGKFKKNSIEACKRELASSLIDNKELNIEITSIIRDKILSRKENQMMDLPELKDEFLKLYNELPKDINKSLWKYKTNAMKPYREQIDKISKLYLDNYQKDNFNELKDKLQMKQELYEKVYGSKNNAYNKTIEDLYYRLGNVILKEMITFDKMQQRDYLEDKYELLDKQNETKQILAADDKILDESEIVVDFEEEDIIKNSIRTNYKLEWNSQYKQAKNLLYTKKEYAKAKQLLLDEAKEGNILALCDLGDIYSKGLGQKADIEKGNIYYKEALTGLEKLYKKTPKRRDYLSYRIGKMYLYGLGTDINYEKARTWLEKSVLLGNQYAEYLLGNMYYNGLGVDKDLDKAIELYKIADNNMYALYKLGDIYKKGIGVDVNEEVANEYYTRAFPGFKKMADADGADGNIKYKVGNMYYNGLGTEKDIDMACKYFNDAIENGNKYAKYKMATLYLKSDSLEEYSKGVTWLEELSKDKTFQNNDFIHFKLGKIYSEGKVVNQTVIRDAYKAKKHYEIAAKNGNSFAQYNLAKLYLEPNSKLTDYRTAVILLKNIKDNPYATAKLGSLYAKGIGVPKNIDKAREYYILADKMGNPYALDMLGAMEKREKYETQKRRKNNMKQVLDTVHRKNKRDMQIAMMQLKRSLNNEYETWKNLQEYEELQYEISKQGESIEV